MSDAHSRPSAPLLGLMLGAMSMFGALAINIYLPAIPAVARELHTTLATVQMTVSTFVAGVAAGQLVWGSWSEVRGRRVPLATGAGLFVTASLVCAVAPSAQWLLIARFLQGFGACAGMVLARAIIADWFRGKEAAKIISWQQLVMGTAPILAPLLGAFLLAHTGWRSIFWLLALLSGLIATVLLLTIPESRGADAIATARQETRLAAYRTLLRTPRISLQLGAASLAAAPLMMWYSAASALFQTTFRWSAGESSWLFGTLGICIVTASQVNRTLLERYRPETIVRTTLIVTAAVAGSALSCILGGVFDATSTAVVLIVSVSGYGLVSANLQAAILGEDPQRSGSISSLIGCAVYGGGGVASALAGLLPPAAGASLLLLMAAALGTSRLLLFIADHTGDVRLRVPEPE